MALYTDFSSSSSSCTEGLNLTLHGNTSSGLRGFGAGVGPKSGLEAAVVCLSRYVLPVIILGGVLGNALCFVVFINTQLRLLSCYVYLAFLNVADTLFLLCLTVNWLGWWQVYLFHRHGWCQALIYISYVSSCLSTWGVVALTAERYVVVFHPLRRQVLCTRRKAVLVLSALTVTAILFYSFAPITHRAVQHNYFGTVCMSDPKYDVLLRVMTGIDTVLTLLVPAVTIITLNIAITVKIWDFGLLRRDRARAADEKYSLQDSQRSPSTRRRRATTSGRGSALQLSEPLSNSPASLDSRRNVQLKTTRSLLVVSTVFVLLNLPSHSLRMHMTLHFLLFTDTPDTDNLQRWLHILQFLSYLNYSANFLLYSACSRSFVRAFKGMCGAWKRALC